MEKSHSHARLMDIEKSFRTCFPPPRHRLLKLRSPENRPDSIYLRDPTGIFLMGYRFSNKQNLGNRFRRNLES